MQSKLGLEISDRAIHKYICKKCGGRDMSPNMVGEYAKGWKCNCCGEINYPVRDNLNR